MYLLSQATVPSRSLHQTLTSSSYKNNSRFRNFSGNVKNRETLKKENMTKIENQTAVTFAGETTKLPSGAIKNCMNNTEFQPSKRKKKKFNAAKHFFNVL